MIALICAIVMIWLAPKPLRVPMVVFNGIYVLTTAIGATILTWPSVRSVWALMFPSMDETWLTPGADWGYWFELWGPLVITNLAAVGTYRHVRKSAVVGARLLRARVDVLAAGIVGFGFCAYCFVNLASRGYLGLAVFNADTAGSYKLNIEMRAELFGDLGTLHFAFIYMAIPSIIMVAFHRAVRQKSSAWWTLMMSLSGLLCYLYLATFTKSNMLIFGLELVVAARALGLIGVPTMIGAGAAGIFVLMVLSSLLGGTSMLDVAFSVYNIIFRDASAVPFYMAVFPHQVPFSGIDLGLAGFGIGPQITTNLIVSNFMFPHDTWAQGAAPAAAQISAYAQGGYPWSFATMLIVGVWIAACGQLGRIARNPVVFSAFIGSIVTCYYMSQVDLVGAFKVSYGYKWWLAGLILLIGVQRILELALPTTDGGHAEANIRGCRS
ncbi:MAG TPA: hypothetical protein VIC29_14005 [Steroidobacteraceae bacterium]